MICRFKVNWCICSEAPIFSSFCQPILVLHVKEWLKSSNTGHLSSLCFPKTARYMYGREDNQQALTQNEIDRQAVVLFPGFSAKPLSHYLREYGKPRQLIIPDGSWNQAKNIVRRTLLDVPRIYVDSPLTHEVRANIQRPRISPGEQHLSTFEATALALAQIEDFSTDQISALLAFFQKAASRHFMFRGKIKKEQVH